MYRRSMCIGSANDVLEWNTVVGNASVLWYLFVTSLYVIICTNDGPHPRLSSSFISVCICVAAGIYLVRISLYPWTNQLVLAKQTALARYLWRSLPPDRG